MTNNDWEKVEVSSVPTWDYKTQNEIIGVLKEIKTNVGPNNSILYTLETANGDIGVWGTSLLDVRFRNLKIGEEVKIVYLGKAKSEKTGRSYHNFEVYYKKTA